MKIVKKVMSALFKIFTVIIGILLLLSVDAWMQVSLFKKEYATLFNHSVFNVVTGSMSGTIEINDYVLVELTQDVKINDIITFKSDKELVTHRLVQISGDNYITRGDANSADDYSIKKTDIVGKVKKVIPKAGIWKNVISDPKVLVSIFITLLLFTLVFSTEERKYKKTTYKADLTTLKPKKKEYKEKSIPMKIGFLFKKQAEINENNKEKEEVYKNRKKINKSNKIDNLVEEFNDSVEMDVDKIFENSIREAKRDNKKNRLEEELASLDKKVPTKKKKIKKVKANLEALKK